MTTCGRRTGSWRRKNLYMEQQMEVLRQEFKASGGHSVSRASARGIAQRILKLTGSKYGVDRLSGDLWRVFNVEGNGEPTLNADAMDALTDVMRGVLNESEQKTPSCGNTINRCAKPLRGTTLEVRQGSAEFAELMNAYGDGKNGRQWGNVRKGAVWPAERAADRQGRKLGHDAGRAGRELAGNL